MAMISRISAQKKKKKEKKNPGSSSFFFESRFGGCWMPRSGKGGHGSGCCGGRADLPKKNSRMRKN